MNSELDGMWKEAVIAGFKILYQHMHITVWLEIHVKYELYLYCWDQK
jgi:hypothetical protein